MSFLAATAADAESIADDWEPPTATEDLVAGLVAARRLKAAADRLASDYEAALCQGRNSGDMVEHDGVVVEVRWSKRPSGWKQDELRADLRVPLLFDENGERRSGEAVLDLLWADKTGLQPLNSAMRRGVLRDVWGVDIDEYAETRMVGRAQILTEALV